MATNCSNCNNCKDECSCIPTGLTTPNYCISDTPLCPEPAPCTETFDSQCVIYTGTGNDCFNIESGQTVEEIIELLATKLQPLVCLGCVSTIIPANNAVNIASNQVLSWAPVANATGYDVYFSTNQTSVQNSLPGVLVSSNQPGTNYDPTGFLLSDTAYYWKVVPRNASGASTGCLTFKFTTEATCINPLVQVFDDIIAAIPPIPDPQDLAKYIADYIELTLNTGIVLGKSCGACCPDCITNRYILSSAESYLKFIESIPGPSPCCIELAITVEAYLKMLDGGYVAPTGTCNCDSNYATCLQQLKDLFSVPGWNDVLSTGIIEESTIGGFTSLCIIKQFIDDLPAILTEQNKIDILKALLDVGVVVECNANGTIITSISTYLNFP